jgi:hypothetical protein
MMDFKIERDIMPENKDVNIEALTNLCTPWCVFVVATLRIAEYVDEGVHSIIPHARKAVRDQWSGTLEKTASMGYGFLVGKK